MTHALYYVDARVRHAIVAASPDDAARIAREQEYVIVSEPSIRVGITATLATDQPPCAVDLARVPPWEYPYLGDLADDAEEHRDRDIVVESGHTRRRWTLRRWLAEQTRSTRPAELVLAAPVDDGWGAPPTIEETRAHHAAHAVGGVSLWQVRVQEDPFARVANVRDGALDWLPSETSRWRPCDAMLTPVARKVGAR